MDKTLIATQLRRAYHKPIICSGRYASKGMWLRSIWMHPFICFLCCPRFSVQLQSPVSRLRIYPSVPKEIPPIGVMVHKITPKFLCQLRGATTTAREAGLAYIKGPTARCLQGRQLGKCSRCNQFLHLQQHLNALRHGTTKSVCQYFYPAVTLCVGFWGPG